MLINVELKNYMGETVELIMSSKQIYLGSLLFIIYLGYENIN